MRSGMTRPERRLWWYLRKRQLDGWRFRRQHPMPPFIADFACIDARLLIELDGDSHRDPEADAKRDRLNADRGYRTLRFGNREVMRDIDGVLEVILQALNEPLPLRPSGTSPGGGGSVASDPSRLRGRWSAGPKGAGC
jgi:very-short-patch-repair endonuclease